MDANYVMDETLGTASYEISKLTVGETKTETFRIGKVRYATDLVQTFNHSFE